MPTPPEPKRLVSAHVAQSYDLYGETWDVTVSGLDPAEWPGYDEGVPAALVRPGPYPQAQTYGLRDGAKAHVIVKGASLVDVVAAWSVRVGIRLDVIELPGARVDLPAPAIEPESARTMTEYLNLSQIAQRHRDRLAAEVASKANARHLFPEPDVRVGVLARNFVHGWKVERVDRWITEELAAAAGNVPVTMLSQRHLRFIEAKPWWPQRVTVLVGASDIIAACPSVEPLRIRRALVRAGSEGERLAIHVGNRTGWHPSEAAGIIAAEGWRAKAEVADRIDEIITALQ